jgi:hypothetical protein
MVIIAEQAAGGKSTPRTFGIPHQAFCKRLPLVEILQEICKKLNWPKLLTIHHFPT